MAIAGPEYECLYADPGPQRKRRQGGREVGGASPLTISSSKIIFFQVKSENIKFLHVKNIWDLSVFIEQALSDKK